MIEIIITVLIAVSAAYILYKNISRKMSGKCECECENCSRSCSMNKNGSCCK